MSSPKTHTPYRPKVVKVEIDGEPCLLGRDTIAELLRKKKLYELKDVAPMVDRCVRYLRRLCHGERGRRIAHLRILGRYYMTPAQVAALIQPVEAKGE